MLLALPTEMSQCGIDSQSVSYFLGSCVLEMPADPDELGLPIEEQLSRQRRRGRDLKSQLDLAQSKTRAVEVRPALTAIARSIRCKLAW